MRDASGVHQLPYNTRPLNTVISAVHAAAMDLRFANSWAWHGRPRCGAVRRSNGASVRMHGRHRRCGGGADVRHVTSRVQESFRLTPPARVSSNRCKASASLALLAEAEGRDRGSAGDVDRPAQRRDVGTQPNPNLLLYPLPFPVGWVGRIGKAQLRPTRRESCERAARRLSPAAGPRLSGGAASRSRNVLRT